MKEQEIDLNNGCPYCGGELEEIDQTQQDDTITFIDKCLDCHKKIVVYPKYYYEPFEEA